MQDAVTLLRSACQIDARSLDAQVALGRSLLEAGEYDSCMQPLLVALELRPGYDETHYLLAQAYSLSGQRDNADEHLKIVSAAREALEELDQLNADVLTDPNNAAKLIRAGEIMMTYGDPEEGVLRILTGLDHEPNNQSGLQLLANHYHKKAGLDENFRQLASEFQQRLDDADSTGAGQSTH
jgi:predicted Zn-dependent protease